MKFKLKDDHGGTSVVHVRNPSRTLPESYVSATFASDGSQVFAVPNRGPAARWDVRPEAWARHACAVAGRSLTEREWRDALPERPFQRVC